jgi:hypothetical protein
MKTVEATTIIANPSWGKCLELFQEKGNIRLLTTDSDAFKKILESIKLKYSFEDDIETKLTRFILLK